MKTLKRLFIISGLAATISLVSMAQATQTKPAGAPAAKPATPAQQKPAATQTAPSQPAKKEEKAAKKPAAGKTDPEIQSCIQTRMASSAKIKSEGFNVSVSGGVATFTGATSNSGTKGGVSGMAKACGASKVVNNITYQKPAAKPAAKP